LAQLFKHNNGTSLQQHTMHSLRIYGAYSVPSLAPR
jgi:hypothetical protein